LLAATSPDSVIARFIEKRGMGIHHLAFLVDDLETEAERLQAAGFHRLGEGPEPGADGMMVLFLHPADAGGVLVELCKSRNGMTRS